MESRKFQRKFENGIYTPERKFDFNRPEHKMDKLIFEIIEWKTMTVISGATCKLFEKKKKRKKSNFVFCFLNFSVGRH